MRLTHLGHACLLVEVSGQRILIDPGNLAGNFECLRDLDAIVTTHQHLDHADPARIPGLVANNPTATLLAEPQTAAVLAQLTDLRPEPMTPGRPVSFGSVEVTPVGELHAFIHESLPRIGNLGVVITSANEPTVFHPGDSYDAEPGPVDVLALPINAPWAYISATAAFVNRINPRFVVPIHDGLLNSNGRAMYLRLVATFGPRELEVRDLIGGERVHFA